MTSTTIPAAKPLTVGSARIRYTTHPATGATSGRNLVLVHGTGGGSGMWDPLVPSFTDRHTVHLPDLSGSGVEDVSDDGGDLAIEQLAAEIVAVIEDAGGRPVDLLGFSLGAVAAAAAAALRPDLVDRLVLVAGWSDPDDEYLRNMMTVWLAIADNPVAFGRYATLTAFSRDHLNTIGRDAVEANAAFMQPTPGTLRQIALNLRLDIRHLLPRITADTLVLGCRQDATVPVANSRALHAAITGSTYDEFDTGHVVVYEQTEAFVTRVRAFLDRA